MGNTTKQRSRNGASTSDQRRTASTGRFDSLSGLYDSRDATEKARAEHPPCRSVGGENMGNYSVQVPEALGLAPIELRFYGTCAPQGSKSLTRWGMKESSDRVAPWRTSIQYACRDQYKGPVIDSPVHIFVTFVLPRAKAHWSTKKGCEDQLKPSAPTHCTIGGDIDKQCRAVLDGLSATCGGCILKDDRLVTHLAAQKRYAEAGEPTGALVRVQIVR